MADSLDVNFVLSDIESDSEDVKPGTKRKQRSSSGSRPAAPGAQAGKPARAAKPAAVAKKGQPPAKRLRFDKASDLSTKPAAEQAEGVWLRLKAELQQQFTDMELGGLSLHASQIADTSASFGLPREDANLVQFIKEAIPTWDVDLRQMSAKARKKLSKHKSDGQDGGMKALPRVVIVCSSGQRCVDVIRLLAPFKDMSPIAKLFSKHFKVSEQVDFLNKNDSRICVGTPNRLEKLASEGALDFSRVQVVIFDMKVDATGRSIFEIAEVRKDLASFFRTTLSKNLIADQTPAAKGSAATSALTDLLGSVFETPAGTGNAKLALF